MDSIADQVVGDINTYNNDYIFTFDNNYTSPKKSKSNGNSTKSSNSNSSSKGSKKSTTSNLYTFSGKGSNFTAGNAPWRYY
jgi:hypothetical protein